MKWKSVSDPPKVRDRYYVKTQTGYGKGAATYDPEPIYGGSNWDADKVIEWLDETESPSAPVEQEGQELWEDVKADIKKGSRMSWYSAERLVNLLKYKYTITKK